MKLLNISILFAGETWTKCTKEYSVAIVKNGEQLLKVCNLITIGCNDPSYCRFQEVDFILRILEKLKMDYDLIEINAQHVKQYDISHDDIVMFNKIMEWINSGLYKTTIGSVGVNSGVYSRNLSKENVEGLQKYNLKMIEGLSIEDMDMCTNMVPKTRENVTNGMTGVYILK